MVPVLRCIFAIVLGLVLVLWPEAAVTYLVITIGICFIIPGLFSLLNYFTREKVEGEPSQCFRSTEQAVFCSEHGW